MDDLTIIIVRGVCECDPPNPVNSETLSISVQDLTGIIDSAVCNHLSTILPGVYYMDPPDGGDVSVLEQLRRMARDAERCRWLKERNSGPIGIVAWHQDEEKEMVLTEAEADAAIDMARALLDEVRA